MSALHQALRVARDMIATDRHAFADCNVLPEGGFDADDAQVVADYDRALAQIDAALAASETLAERPGYVCASPLLYQHAPQQPAPAERGEQTAKGLTDGELQSLRNLGNEAEAAANEIVQLRAALASAPRVPLTDEQVFDLIPSTGLLPRRDALWLARAVERAHGIAAAPQPEGGAS